MLSFANACKIRGAPIMDPSAEDKVAANTPAKINAPLQAVSFITKPSPRSVSRELLIASKTAIIT